jgi:hypothetical protein
MESSPDRQRWWLCDLDGEPVGGGALYEAPTARRALARFRADMIEHFLAAADSRTHARDIVRANHPKVYAGPLTTAEAFEHELGWAWAWEMCGSRYVTHTIASPAAPATRAQAVEVLGEKITARMEHQAAQLYGVAA